MNIEQLYQDHNIPYQTEGHKHCRPGWVNTECPFCTGNPGLHLGYDTSGDTFVCWRCGGHYSDHTISELLNISKYEASDLLRKYGILVGRVRKTKNKVRINPFKLPSNTEPLKANHKKYLISRNFDPDRLVKKWGIYGTGVHSILDKINYKHRIIIPFMWDGKMVSFDSRDITDKSQNKYMACPDARETIGHKQILYGDQSKWGDVGICVEGPTDVWRMGKNSFATSGIKYTAKQLRIMSNTFKRIFIMFDDEPQAVQQALKLAADLKFRGVEGIVIRDIEGDPGGMDQKEADYLVTQMI